MLARSSSRNSLNSNNQPALSARQQAPRSPFFSKKNKTRQELVDLIQSQLGCNYLLVDVNDFNLPCLYSDAKKALSKSKISFLGKVTEKTLAEYIQSEHDSLVKQLKTKIFKLESILFKH